MATVQVKYAEMFTLSVRQLFYANQVCPAYQTTPVVDFKIIPTQECLDFMKTKNMVFKNTDSTGGFVVLARLSPENQGGNSFLSRSVSNQDKLSFIMVLQNPDLVNFDSLTPPLPPNYIYYFSNQVNDGAAMRNNLHLTKGAAGVDGANDQIKTTSASYTYHFGGNVTVNDVKVKHLITGSVISAKAVNSQNGQSDIYFDLSPLPSGCCQLLVDNVLTDTFYFLGTMSNQPVFGVVELSLSSLLPANYRIVEADQSLTAARPGYVIQFNNRPTTWRYTIQLQPTSPLYRQMAALTPAQKTTFINQLDVVSNDNTIKFKLASNTDQSFVFTSVGNIALQEKYSSSNTVNAPLIISLNSSVTQNSNGDVIRYLPYPSPGIIDSGNIPIIYSDVFVSL